MRACSFLITLNLGLFTGCALALGGVGISDLMFWVVTGAAATVAVGITLALEGE